VLADSWQPADATESNGAVWPTLGTAVWALRSGLPFADAMRAVIALGGDTDTVACVTGGLLGATYGIEAIPGRWSSALMGDVPASEICPAGIADLQQLAARLDGAVPSPEPVPGVGIDAMEVEPGLWLSDLEGAVRASGDLVVLSLCRTFGRLRQANQRQFYLVDSDGNLTPETVLREVVDTIDAVRAEGHPVLVHCYGGASRTGLVLRAWLRRSRGLSADAANAEATRLWPHTARWNTSFDQVLEEFS
jgi:ADP-ribosyl-[dinitrogen reductase] hydrolase